MSDEVRKVGQADIDQVAVTNRDFMSTRPNQKAPRPAAFRKAFFCSDDRPAFFGSTCKNITVRMFWSPPLAGTSMSPYER
jgi:hypothetical protein